MAVILNYTKAQYQQKINSLKTRLVNLENHLDKLETYKNQVQDFWDDDRGREVYTLLSQEIRTVTNAHTRVNDLVLEYEKMVNDLDAQNNLLKTDIGEALDLVNKIGI